MSRQTIMRRCGIDGMVRRKDGKPLNFQPVSIDIHLDETDLGADVLLPGIFCLASIIETFRMPDDVVGFVQGKSTYAREGLLIEAAGLIDPGFHGDIVLELKNLHHWDPFKLVPGMSIGQVHFNLIDEPVDVPYGGLDNHYQGQRGVTRSYRKAF